MRAEKHKAKKRAAVEVSVILCLHGALLVMRVCVVTSRVRRCARA